MNSPQVRSCLTVISLALMACSACLAATYHVDGVNGSDDNDGINSPFKTIAKGAGALSTSDSLVIAKTDEPYRESLPVTVGGTAQAPLVIDGGGATLTGADPASKTGWTQNGDAWSLPQAQEVKFLFGPDICYTQGKSAAGLQPEQWFWETASLSFRPAEGKTPADYDLEMSVRVSGIIMTGAGRVIIRNLTCRNFYNDGFNIHGGSAPVWFENIRGEWNGDEGFSCHENCECYIRGGYFAHNQWHGITDVSIARSHYASVTCRDNVHKGIFFVGGFHSVIDSEVSGSPINIAVQRSDVNLPGFPSLEQHPLRTSESNFRNVVVRSAPGEIGVQVQPDAEGVFEHCLIEGGRVGLNVLVGGTAYVINSVIHGAQTNDISSAGTFAADHNVYHPGRLAIGDQSYGPEEFDAYREATGNDAHSFISKPAFIGDTVWASRASVARGKAYDTGGYGGSDIGPVPGGIRPQESASVLPPEAKLTDSGRILYSYDFEQSNPWSRVYPEPAQNQAGEAVKAVSELSAEQAHSGKRSAKMAVTFPGAPPGKWMIKLFSDRFPHERPVEALRFWLYGNGSGATFRPRIRDRSGECFYGAMQTMDWSGWEQIAWDLVQTPPESIAAGDGNRKQDLPPVEIVCELFIAGAQPGEEFVVYVDDLEVELRGD